MPDKPEPPAGAPAKKKQTKTIAIVGVVALVAGLGFIWWRNRQASGGGGTSSSAGSPALTGTDMGDIVQTVQGPPGPAGPRGPAGKAPKKPVKKKRTSTDKKG